MIQPENNATGRSLHAPDREEHMRTYLFGQPFMSTSSPSSPSDIAITFATDSIEYIMEGHRIDIRE